MTTLHFQVTSKRLINTRQLNTLSALRFGKETKWVTTYKTIEDGCAYACTPHKVQLK